MGIVEKYVKELYEVLRSLSIKKYINLCAKYGIPMPKSERIMLASMHKARLEINAFSEEEKEVSRKWLLENGFKPYVEWFSYGN